MLGTRHLDVSLTFTSKIIARKILNIIDHSMCFILQRVLMQITQELCKRPGLNKAGFDMQTIYVPNLIDKVCLLRGNIFVYMSRNSAQN